MSFFEAVVVPIKLEKHPNADSLSVVNLTDPFVCSLVVRTEDWVGKDRAIYCPIDAVLPLDNPKYDYIGKDHRVRAKKLRGIVSNGVLIPCEDHHKVGDIVTNEIGMTKWESPADQESYSTRANCAKSPLGEVKYTDIENLRKYHDVINANEIVVMQEKLHGCVKFDTKVKMFDFTNKYIRDIKIGDIILGYENGLVVETKVTDVSINKSNKQWLKIKITRAEAGKGNSYAVLYATEDHKILTMENNQECYKPLKDFKVNDEIFLIRNDLELTPIQKQILIGKMLGDGSLGKRDTSAYVNITHKKDHEEYMDWCLSGLTNIANWTKDYYISGFGTEVRAKTISSINIKNLFHNWFDENNKKIVPESIIKDFSPISMAFWYMDDGSLSHHEDQEDRANFAVCGFDENSCNNLVKCLEKFNINAKLKKYGKYYRIRLNAEEAEKMFILISPFIPPIMQYKLPERYRGYVGWMPKKDSIFKNHVTKQKILNIEKTTSYDEYDIETETHNFFANEILVHNSNSRFVVSNIDGKKELHCGSRTRWVKDDGNIWWKVAEKINLKEKINSFPDHIFFGEVYGKVQDLKYDTDLAFRLFDIYSIPQGKYLDWPEVVEIAQKIGIDLVPILYEGEWMGFEKSLSFAEGKSTLANHCREGFVVKPIKERYSGTLGRVILKLHGEDYLTRK